MYCYLPLLGQSVWYIAAIGLAVTSVAMTTSLTVSLWKKRTGFPRYVFAMLMTLHLLSQLNQRALIFQDQLDNTHTYLVHCKHVLFDQVSVILSHDSLDSSSQTD